MDKDTFKNYCYNCLLSIKLPEVIAQATIIKITIWKQLIHGA